MTGLLVGLVAGSLGTGIALLALGRHTRLASRVGKVSSLCLAALSPLLLLQAGDGTSARVGWIPETETAALTLRAPAVYLAIMAFGALALAQTWRAEPFFPENGARYWSALAHLLCSLVVVALTVDQFLARYIVLELVALCTMVVLALGIPGLRHGLQLWSRYAQLRLGDIGLIVTILLLWRASGTFLIEEMLARATFLSPREQIPILLGGLLAVWAKMGLPPLHGWVVDSALLPWQARVWAAGAALPLLGAYLLYRLTPLLLALGATPLLTVGGVVILVWASAKLLRSGPRPGGSSWWFIGHSAVGLLLAGTQSMSAFLLTFLPIRVVLCLAGARAPRRVKWTWEADGKGALAGLDALVRAARTIERHLLEAGNRRLAEGVKALSRLTASALEGRILEGLNRGGVRLARSIGRTLQDVHVGRLRRNLLWASLGVIAVVAFTIAAFAR